MTGDDHMLARDLARLAGQRLTGLRARGGDPDVLRKAGDRLSHEFLTAQLAARRPGDVVLSEEGADNRARLAELPGAVHVALWEDGDLTAGAVALPAQGTVLSTAEPPPPPPRPHDGAPGRIRIVVSRSRPPRFVRNISGLIDAELVPLGSAGAKVAAVINGEVDAYVHGGGFYEWDTAAPVAVARAAGLHASRIDGSALAYNQADLLMPDILVCRPAVAGALLQAIREVTNASAS
jgi:3'(2'), 5'-bisphosphate nucleotidase